MTESVLRNNLFRSRLSEIRHGATGSRHGTSGRKAMQAADLQYLILISGLRTEYKEERG